jgi:hypothetical protein
MMKVSLKSPSLRKPETNAKVKTSFTKVKLENMRTGEDQTSVAKNIQAITEIL